MDLLTDIRRDNEQDTVDAHPRALLVEEEHVGYRRRTDAQTRTTAEAHEHPTAQGRGVRLGSSHADRSDKRDDLTEQENRPASNAVAERDPDHGCNRVQD